jgi:hypothetical protein
MPPVTIWTLESLSKRTKSDDDYVVDNFCLSCTLCWGVDKRRARTGRGLTDADWRTRTGGRADADWRTRTGGRGLADAD